MGTDQNSKAITVKPGARNEWRVSIDGRNEDLPFSARHLAIDFARAYAQLRRAGTLQIYNEKGILEREEQISSARRSVEQG
jgi:hypothetical protein